MSTTTFENIDNEIPAEAQSTAVVPAAKAGTEVVAGDFFSNEGLEGEFNKGDLKIPGLNLVQGVGPLSEFFTPGQVIYNGEEVIYTPPGPNQPVPAPVKITVVKARKFLQEKLPYGSEVMPRRFNTEQEARGAGLYPLWEKNDAPKDAGFFQPVLDCQVLIEGDPEKNSSWPLEFEGKVYAMARWYIQSVAYNVAAKTILTATQLGGLRNHLFEGYWLLAPKREKVGQNLVWLPRIRWGNKHTPEFIEWVKSQLA